MNLPLIHPIVVHFPIAFYFLELLFLLFWRLKRDDQFLRFARFSFRLAYLSMLVAMTAGLIDVKGIQNVTGHVRTHALSALTVFGFYTLRAFAWRFVKPGDKHFAATQILFALTGNILVAITGHLGSELVYE